MKDCCLINDKNERNNKQCKRKSDNKIFSLPRRFSRSSCKKTLKKGFTMRSSCAPYKDCNNKINKLRSRRTHKNRKKHLKKRNV